MSRSLFILALLAALITFLYASPPAVLAAGNWNSPMGITTRNDNVTALRTADPWGYMENRIKLMTEAGVAWDRLLVSSGYVFNTDGTIKQDHLSRLDRVLALYKQYHLNAYFLLYNDSALIGPSTLGACPYIYHYPPDNQAKWAKWTEYLSLLVDRYGGDIKYWEISFEENNPGCPFGDHPDMYVNFLKRSAAVIREHDPQAKIILGRLLPNKINYLNALLENNAAPSFDVVSLGGPYQCSLYDDAAKRTNSVKNILSRNGISKPIWLTEALCVSDHDLDGVNDAAGYEDQKKYIKEVYKQALAAGVQKIFFQSFVDRKAFSDFLPVYKQMSGIMSIDDAFALHKKPSYSAYQQAARDAGFPPPTPSPSPNPADLTNEDDEPGNQVNEADYNLLLSDFGKTGTPGFLPADINDDGVVDGEDYNMLVGAFGE